MRTLTTIHDMQKIWQERMTSSERPLIGLVPTMGYLHEGHLSLLHKAREETDLVVLSIFVNPLQFGENEDYDQYPRDMKRDEQLAREHGVDIIFAPDRQEMYPDQPLTTVSVANVTQVMCGRSRPGHFDGMATVVMKLFQIIRPDKAYFGLKDAQQVAVLEQMVRDLNVPVDIRPCPTVREKDGLAMSSRNVYLTSAEREQATVLYQSLRHAQQKVDEGVRDARQLRQIMVDHINTQPLAEIEYADIRSFPSLDNMDILEGRVILALAVRFAETQTRLIDNVVFRCEAM